jgi:hypothetical protein
MKIFCSIIFKQVQQIQIIQMILRAARAADETEAFPIKSVSVFQMKNTYFIGRRVYLCIFWQLR